MDLSQVYPMVDANKYMTITYYDNYDFRTLWIGAYGYVNESLTAIGTGITYTQPVSEFTRLTGQVTGSKVKALESGSTIGYTWLKSISYYDDKSRVVQTLTDNYKGGIDRMTNVIDFTGKVLKSKVTHTRADVTWKDIVGILQTGNKATRTVAGASWTASGAASVQQLAAGQNGWVEAIASETNTYRMFGLSDTNPDVNYTSIDYAWYLINNGTLGIYESGVSRAIFPAYAPGDVLRIERTGTVINYYQNNILKYTSTVASSTLLMADASLYDLNSTLVGVRSSFSSSTKSTTRRLEYDHAGRLLKTWHQLDAQPEILLAQNEYNEVGQLVDKKQYSTDGTTFKQSVDHRYNIRGWLTSINNAQLAVNSTNDDTNDLFGMELAYNNSLSGLSNTAMFNGNISAMKWSVNQGLGTPVFGTPTERAYNFAYDPLNRLQSASHLNNIGAWAPATSFNEDNLSYDYNGNIKTLSRKGQGGSVMDVLSYDYGTGNNISNQLLKVSDTGDKTKGFVDGTNIDNDYLYDANGNMNSDKNKTITAITYNHLNLPVKVTKSTGDYIIYTYNAGGAKLSQSVYNPANVLKKKTDYVGEYFYENDTLKFINHEEGRVTMTGAAPEYQYNLKDHLGNVRLTFTTKDEVHANTATMETANAPTEQSQFINYAEAITVNTPIFDHTNSVTTFYSTRLTGTANERIGLAKSLSVMPGDKIDIEVFAKYLDTNPANLTPALAAFIASIATGGGAPAGTIIDGGLAGSLGSGTFPFPNVLVRTGDNGTGPKGYLNYLIFDRDFVYKTGGFKRLSTAARETGTDIAHERLAFDGIDQILIREPGYVYIWISNENDTPVEAYFDDFKVTHTKSPVIQSDSYYPFGLTFNSYQRENTVANQYLYNGIEHQDELNLGWDLAQFRAYEPTLGRFMQIDPVIKEHESPYSWNTNNPILYPDPTGADTLQRAKALAQAQKYIDEKPTGNSYSFSDKGGPGQKTDCSGMQSNCAEVGGEPNPNKAVVGGQRTATGSQSGVLNIEDNTTEVHISKAQPGNFITFRGTSDWPYHIGMLSSKQKNENGSYDITFMHASTGTNGPDVTTFTTGDNSNFANSLHGFYKWDTLPDFPKSNKSGSTISQGRQPSMLDIMVGSSSPIIRDLGRIIQNFIN